MPEPKLPSTLNLSQSMHFTTTSVALEAILLCNMSKSQKVKHILVKVEHFAFGSYLPRRV